MRQILINDAWEGEIGAWSEWLRSSMSSQETIYLRTFHVRRLAEAHPHVHPWAITLDMLITFLAPFDWSPSTRRSWRASFRTFYHWAHVTGRVLVDPAALLPVVRPDRPHPRPAPEPIYLAAVARAAADVKVMLRLARQAGLRRGEISRVHTDDLEPDLDGWSLRVHGKGGKLRKVPLLDDLADIVGAAAGWVFPGRIDGHLSPAYVGKLMSRALGPGWTAHPLRHSFATRTHRASGNNLRVVQELLGHASVATTQIYVAVDDQELRAAVLAVA